MVAVLVILSCSTFWFRGVVVVDGFEVWEPSCCCHGVLGLCKE